MIIETLVGINIGLAAVVGIVALFKWALGNDTINPYQSNYTSSKIVTYTPPTVNHSLPYMPIKVTQPIRTNDTSIYY